MLICQCRNSFDFDDDLAVTNEIGGERLDKGTIAISEALRRLRKKWNSLQFKFDFQALVINRLEEAAALLFVNGKTRADDGVTFIFVDQFRRPFVSCHSCVWWAKI